MMAIPVINNATIVAERLFMGTEPKNYDGLPGTETLNSNELHVYRGRICLRNPERVQYVDPDHAIAYAKEIIAMAKLVKQGRHPAHRWVGQGEATNVSNGKKRRIIK
jgi:hypothetical protein